jgi:glutathione S-transferase
MKHHCLYSFRRCPYAIRARMTLLYAGIPVELRELKLSNKPSEFTRLSAKATVPVLLTADGELLDESLDIMHWALAISDPDQWSCDNSRSNDMIRLNDEEFKPLLDAYKYADRHPHPGQLEHRARAEPFLRQIEEQLTSQHWLMGERQTISDIAIMPFVRQFAGVEPLWFANSEYVRTRQWLGQQIESQLFQQTMQKFAFWRSGDKAVYLEAGKLNPGD